MKQIKADFYWILFLICVFFARRFAWWSSFWAYHACQKTPENEQKCPKNPQN